MNTVLRFPKGAKSALELLPERIDAPAVPDALKPMLQEVLGEIRELSRRIGDVEKQLKVSRATIPRCRPCRASPASAC